MIYIICIKRNEEEQIIGYRIYDSCSDSTMTLKPYIIKQLILNNTLPIVNASIQDNDIIIKDWANGIAKEDITSKGGVKNTTQLGPKYILIAKEDNSYKILNCNGSSHIIYNEKLDSLIRSGAVANCNLTQYEDIYTIQTNKEFERHIKEKYNSFIAKTILLGKLGIEFNYKIENSEVRLEMYTGTNTDVILPPFITAIKDEAFKKCDITSVVFSKGLKVIGSEAFCTRRMKGIDQVEIPSTVELIGERAFMGNAKLSQIDGSINKERFKLLNTRTIVLEQGFQEIQFKY